MAQYEMAAKEGFKLQIKFIKDRMKERKVTQKALAEIIGVNQTTLMRNFNLESEMSHLTFLKICGALEINPYLIPKEINKDNFFRVVFN